jgi:hypothetical protein
MLHIPKITPMRPAPGDRGVPSEADGQLRAHAPAGSHREKFKDLITLVILLQNPELTGSAKQATTVCPSLFAYRT